MSMFRVVEINNENGITVSNILYKATSQVSIKEEGKEKQQNQPLIWTNRKRFCCGIKVND